jgi:hypothetical protein
MVQNIYFQIQFLGNFFIENTNSSIGYSIENEFFKHI